MQKCTWPYINTVELNYIVIAQTTVAAELLLNLRSNGSLQCITSVRHRGYPNYGHNQHLPLFHALVVLVISWKFSALYFSLQDGLQSIDRSGMTEHSEL